MEQHQNSKCQIKEFIDLPAGFRSRYLNRGMLANHTKRNSIANLPATECKCDLQCQQLRVRLQMGHANCLVM